MTSYCVQSAHDDDETPRNLRTCEISDRAGYVARACLTYLPNNTEMIPKRIEYALINRKDSLSWKCSLLFHEHTFSRLITVCCPGLGSMLCYNSHKTCTKYKCYKSKSYACVIQTRKCQQSKTTCRGIVIYKMQTVSNILRTPARSSYPHDDILNRPV